MADRKNLGQILQQYGRVSDEDQERALAYQRAHGGYFGEALVALGIISQEELEFGLAAQFNLPYVFPDPETIDPEAARLVAPEWALAHMALPLARTSESLSVVVDSPLKAEMIQELEARTGLSVELAIASPSRIRELIRHVFDEGDDEEGGVRPATGVDDFLDEALASGAVRLGVSLRARKVLGWWEEGGRMVRRHLTAGWPGALERRLRPGLAELRDDAGEHRDAQLEWGGTELAVAVRRVASPSGEELMIELRRMEEDPAIFDPPPTSVVEEVRLLARAGAARFELRTDPPELADEILPHLPRVFLGSHVRSAHLVGEGHGGSAAAAGFQLVLPGDPDEAVRFLSRMRAFRLDAVTAHPDRRDPALEGALARVAGAVFLAVEPSGEGSEDPGDPAFGWLLRITREEGDRLAWKVAPLLAGP